MSTTSAAKVFLVYLALGTNLGNRLTNLQTAIQQGRDDGMQSFNNSLHGLITSQLIAVETGLEISDNPEELQMMLQGIQLNSARGGLLK